MKIIKEELAKPLRDVIDNPDLPSRNKHAAMAKLLKNMLHQGMETGLADAKPKKGSSRAVYFPSEPDDITIDGTPTKMHTVLKVAFPGDLDKYTDDETLLGEHQNIHEGGYYLQKYYGVLRHDHETNGYETNEDGILAPVIHAHEDGHYLHMGRISPIGASDFRELTKNEDFPKGISHQEFKHAVEHEYGHANSNSPSNPYSEERMEKLKNHPLIRSAIGFSLDTGTNPADFDKRNMGVWEHPTTGKKHIVLADYGASDHVLKMYAKAWTKKTQIQRQSYRGW